MGKLVPRVKIRSLMIAVALVAALFGAMVGYVRSRRTNRISILAARAVISPPDPDVKSLMFSDDGSFIAAAGPQAGIQLWHTSTTWPMTSIPEPRRAFSQMAFSSDGRWMVVTDAGSEVPSVRQSVLRCLELNHGLLPLPDMGSTQQRLRVADSRLYAGFALAFSPDGRWIASGGLNSIEIRERATLRASKSLRGNFAIPRLLAYARNGQLLAVGDNNGAVAMFDLDTGAQRFVRNATTQPVSDPNAGQTGHSLGITSLALCRSDTRLISLGGDNQLKVWDTATGALLTQIRVGALSGWADSRSVLAVTADEKRVVTASKSADLAIWDLDTVAALRKSVLPPLPPNYYVTELALSRNGASLAAVINDGGQNSRIVLWNTRDLFAASNQAVSPIVSPTSSASAP